MSRVFSFSLCLLVLGAAGCERSATLEDLRTRTVTLPNGQKIIVEVLIQADEMARGMMFRDSLPPDRGMLFVHSQAGRYPYWMHQCLIPLDIIWIGSDRGIVEISADTPPCPGQASECPNYGGNREAQFVLELAGGMARKYGLQLGDRISF